MTEQTITELLVEQKIAENGWQAGHIAQGLRLWEVEREEQERRWVLYRKWRPKTDVKNELSSKEAYDLAIAGIDPADVVLRQIELPMEV